MLWIPFDLRLKPEWKKRNASNDNTSRTIKMISCCFSSEMIGKRKDLITLLRATSLLKELPLRILVVGRDEPDFYRQLVDQFALQNRIRFEKPSMDVLSFYAAADLYVGPSLEDSFGLPILEAMACGLPVIASGMSLI
jgi:glycosyltransferase involved in cell wall biosynthesis